MYAKMAGYGESAEMWLNIWGRPCGMEDEFEG